MDKYGDDDEPSDGLHQKFSPFKWLRKREIGSGRCHSFFGTPTKTLEFHLWKMISTGEGRLNPRDKFYHGGVYGIRYSPDGKLLVAACEVNALLVMDPLTSNVICTREHVHTNRCNTVSFIDDRLFATCSDDCTVAVWDLRQLKNEIFMLRGHTNWVKNVEYHKSSKLLLSSSFDGTVRTWDINNAVSNETVSSNVILRIDDLLRMKISPAGESMYVTCIGNIELFAIHNLNVETVADDIGTVSFTNEGLGSSMVHTDTCSMSTNLHDRYSEQSLPCRRQNHCELYRGYGSTADECTGMGVVCQSVDVSPDNSALLLRYERFDDEVTAIHNVKRYFRSRCCDADIEKNSENLNLPRGVPTNILFNEPVVADYIKEVCFSRCGRLIASPFGYGVRIATYDEDFNDYDTHIRLRINRSGFAKNKNCETTSNKMKNYLALDTERCYTIKACFGHKSPVLSTCFSPTHMQLATGSEKGQILLHNPKF